MTDPTKRPPAPEPLDLTNEASIAAWRKYMHDCAVADTLWLAINPDRKDALDDR